MARKVFSILCMLLGLLLPARSAVPADTGKYTIGVFYYPGWKTEGLATPANQPWNKIKPYPEREPLLGWYSEGDVEVINQQLRWAHDHAINFFIFDWYWSSKGVRGDHALSAYFSSTNKGLVKLALLWANHDEAPSSEVDFTSMVRYWLQYYFMDAQYQRIDGRPVVYVFSPAGLQGKAIAFGSSTAELIAKADVIAREYGFPGIYFVAGTPAVSPFIESQAQAYGYSALSAYNYVFGQSYKEMDQGYQRQWAEIVNKSPLPYFPAMTSGWDRRPWGGSTDPKQDLAVSTPDTFEAHLRSAKQFMDKNPAKTMLTGVICCWNEYGEGSYIEPTRRFRAEYLERVRKVFGQSKAPTEK